MCYSAAHQWLWGKKLLTGNNDIILWYLPMLVAPGDSLHPAWPPTKNLDSFVLLSSESTVLTFPNADCQPGAPAQSCIFYCLHDTHWLLYHHFTCTGSETYIILLSSLPGQAHLVNNRLASVRVSFCFKEMSGIEFVAMWSFQYVYSNFTNSKPIGTF